MEKYEKFTVKNSTSLKKQTVYFYLKSIDLSESYISKLRKQEGSILLNNKIANLKAQIKDNDKIEILKNPSSSGSSISTVDCSNLSIVYEDDDYLVVNKPHNLACIPTKSHYSDNLGSQICSYMQRKDPNFVLRILNRLDKETAGLIVIAKNLFAYKNITKIDKTYYALCYGNLDQNEITINQPILTKNINGINIMKREVSPLGKEAITHITLIKNYKDYCLAKFKLETGRTHQIRVHTAFIQHPLLGDSIYFSKTSKESMPENIPNHTMLILKEISFLHFRINQLLHFEINFPKEWHNFIK